MTYEDVDKQAGWARVAALHRMARQAAEGAAHDGFDATWTASDADAPEADPEREADEAAQFLSSLAESGQI